MNPGDPKDLVELLAGGIGEEEEAENSGFSDQDGNEVAEPPDKEAVLVEATTVDLVAIERRPGERTIVAAGIMRRRPPPKS